MGSILAQSLQGFLSIRSLQHLGEIQASLAQRPFNHFPHNGRIIND
jgi:hypothetical protein